VQVLQKAWNVLSDDAKPILQSAKSNLNALNAVDFGPKRPFSVGEYAEAIAVAKYATRCAIRSGV
jgi:hypothetical protein